MPVFQVATTVCAMALMLAGCALKRSQYEVPASVLPQEFKSALPPQPSGEGAVWAQMGSWWRSLGSRELADLIDRGLANNSDVRIATLRVAQAKIRADQARGAQLPTLSAPMLMGRQSPGGTSIGNISSGGGNNPPQTTYQATLKSTWHFDLWGEMASLADATKFQLWQASFDSDNVRRNVVASIASSYVEYAALNDRIRIAQENEKVLRNILATLEKRVTAGDATVADLEQLRASIYSAQATIPALEQQREDAATSIAFLVGTVPSALKLSDAGLDSLRTPAVLAGVPANLLLRRPDVRMIEARLLAADADIDVARARLLPSVDLSAQTGYSSIYLSKMFTPGYFFWNAIGSVTASIFDGGKRSGDVDQARAVHEEMAETYARVIHQAMREVEGALSAIDLSGRRLDSQSQAVTSARRAWNINQEIYGAGGIDFMALQDTERTYHRYQDDYQRTQSEYFRAYVSLFQALGGGSAQADATDAQKTAAAQTQGEGIDWSGTAQDGGALFWQVELTGLYHAQTIGAAWRDLRTRYPEEMKNRVLRPRLEGKVDEAQEASPAWYRLNVAKFGKVDEAHAFCLQLQAAQQRCRVISSQSDETLVPPAKMQFPAPMAAPRYAKAVTSREPWRAPAGSPQGNDPTGAAQTGAPQAKTTSAPALAEPDEAGIYSVRMGSFASLTEAEQFQQRWQAKQYDTFVNRASDVKGNVRYVLQSGIFLRRNDALAWAQKLAEKEQIQVQVTKSGMDAEGRPVPAGVETQPLVKESARPATALYSVELESHVTLSAAAKSAGVWQARGYSVYVCKTADTAGRVRYAVRTGSFSRLTDATALARTLSRKERVSASAVAAPLNAAGQIDRIDATELQRSSP